MDQYLVQYGAPTLAGLKCGSLFSLPCPCRRRLGQALAEENRRLNGKGLYVAVLRIWQERALVLLYRKTELEQLLEETEEAAFFRQMGYEGGLRDCLQELRRRLAEEAFPHEIGLFLGYPLEDVAGFMEDCRGRNSKCSGCWRVYGDESHARVRFSMYKTCTAAYCSLFLSGWRLEELALAV